MSIRNYLTLSKVSVDSMALGNAIISLSFEDSAETTILKLDELEDLECKLVDISHAISMFRRSVVMPEDAQ